MNEKNKKGLQISSAGAAAAAAASCSFRWDTHVSDFQFSRLFVVRDRHWQSCCTSELDRHSYALRCHHAKLS